MPHDSLDDYAVQIIDGGLHIKTDRIGEMAPFLISPGTLPYSAPSAIASYIANKGKTPQAIVEEARQSIPDLAFRDYHAFGILAIQWLATHPYLNRTTELLRSSRIPQLELALQREDNPDITDEIERERARCALHAHDEWIAQVREGRYFMQSFDPKIPRAVEEALLRMVRRE